MPNDLSQLPPPPSGQTGVTLQSLQGLPPPPSGQKGLTLDQVKQSPQPTQNIPGQSLADKLWSSLANNPNALNPISLVGKGLAAVGKSGLFPGKQVGQAIGTAAGYVASGFNKNYDTSAPSPLQVGGDIAKGAAMVGGLEAPVPTTVLGNVGLGAAAGAVGGAGEAATHTSGQAIPTANDLSQVGKGGVIGGVAGGIVGGATSILGHVIQSAGDKIQITSIKPSKADIADGFSLDTIKNNDLGGSLSQVYEKTQSKLEDLSTQLNQKLQGTDATVNLNDSYNNTVNQLTTNSKKSFGANGSIGNALEWLKNEITAVAPDGNVTIPEAQQIKQGIGKYGAWQFGAQDPESTARQTVANAFYTQMKTSIENNSPEGVKEINQQISKLIPVANAVIRRIPIAERNSALSLTDMMTATASLFNPRALVGLGISLAQKEGAVGNLLSRLAPTIGKFAAPAASAVGTGLSALQSSNNGGQ